MCVRNEQGGSAPREHRPGLVAPLSLANSSHTPPRALSGPWSFPGSCMSGGPSWGLAAQEGRGRLGQG